VLLQESTCCRAFVAGQVWCAESHATQHPLRLLPSPPLSSGVDHASSYKYISAPVWYLAAALVPFAAYFGLVAYSWYLAAQKAQQ
jgi:hypothetical protein